MMTAEQLSTLSPDKLIRLGEFSCECGKIHRTGLRRVLIETGAVNRLPELLREAGIRKPFLLSGAATFRAAGEQVCRTLDAAGIPYAKFVFAASPVVPAEPAVGSAVMHFDDSCDGVIGIGSGVINDIGKLLARLSGRRYLIVATAPSMDGYASASSSMERDGLKVSLDSTAAWAVVGDPDILRAAPMRMLQAGLGDMVAKYISLCEWEISHLITGEYYCPAVAGLVRSALKRCTDAAPALARRDPDAVKAVMEGLVLTGMAMSYAGISRPASGIEHYFSHIWDMRALAFGTKSDLHGIQCGVATLLSLRAFDFLRTLTPDRETALRSAAAFSFDDWSRRLTAFIGPGAAAMIDGEAREHKYDPARHAERLERILRLWPEILRIAGTLPAEAEVAEILRQTGAPADPAYLMPDAGQLRDCFAMTKDIRDKYIVSRLFWDLGRLEDAAARIC